VNQGDTLFLIDNRAFKAEVERLNAQLNEMKSRYKLAVQGYERTLKLRQTNAVSQSLLDERLAEKNQALASINQTKAALDIARLNRGFARVEAPISGRISRANVTEGNYVSAGQTELTRIVSTNQLYAYFDIDEQTYLNYINADLSQSSALGEQVVAMRLANEQEYRHWGQIDFVDNQVNADTGTIRVRGVFNNEDGRLLPGLFAHLKLAGNTNEQSILIQEKAIGTDLSNKFVLVVNSNNEVEYRAVTLGDKVGALRIVKNGLLPSDTIVVNGLQRVRAGAIVDPHVVEMTDKEALASLQNWQSRVDNIDTLVRFEDVLVGGDVTGGLK